jgi:hypothetical protein
VIVNILVTIEAESEDSAMNIIGDAIDEWYRRKKKPISLDYVTTYKGMKLPIRLRDSDDDDPTVPKLTMGE